MSGEALTLVGLRQANRLERTEMTKGALAMAKESSADGQVVSVAVNNANRWSILFVALRLASVCVSLLSRLVQWFACVFCCCSVVIVDCFLLVV